MRAAASLPLSDEEQSLDPSSEVISNATARGRWRTEDAAGGTRVAARAGCEVAAAAAVDDAATVADCVTTADDDEDRHGLSVDDAEAKRASSNSKDANASGAIVSWVRLKERSLDNGAGAAGLSMADL